MVRTAFRVLSQHVKKGEKSNLKDNYNYALAA